jgi:hypothetical protein
LPIAFVLLLGCARESSAPPAPPTAKGGAKEPLSLDATTAGRENPIAARRIAESAHAYFRFTNRQFVDLVCARYADSLASMPSVYAHGDAHLERYAVAADGRGLASFDGASTGPPIVDLARFATSLALVSARDPEAGRAAIDAFARGYERTLDDPSAALPEPAAVARLRQRFAPSPAEWLDRVEKILPGPTKDAAELSASWGEVVAQVRERDPSVDPGYYKLKSGGRVSIGFGGPRVERFVVRAEGTSPGPDDDVILDFEGVEAGALGSCLKPSDLEAVRQRRVQPSGPERFVTAVVVRGTPFFGHVWSAGYTPVRVEDVKSPAELAEVAEDVGMQIGRAHGAGAGLDAAAAAAQRQSLKKSFESTRPGLGAAAVELAAQVTHAWRGYLKDSNQVGWTRGTRPPAPAPSGSAAPPSSSEPAAPLVPPG